MTLSGFITGLLIIVVGFFYTKYHNKIADIVGDLGIGNKMFGGGGAYALHQVIGVLVIIIGILWTTGGFQLMLNAIVGNLFGSMKHSKTAESALLILFG